MKRSILLRMLSVFLALLSLVLCVNVGSYAYHLPDGYTMSNSYKSSVYYTRLAAVQLTGNQRTDIAAIAVSQVGYHEGNKGDYSGTSTYSTANYAEYNRYAYYLNNAAWCGSFISWCAAMAGIPTSILPKTAAAKPYYWKMCGSNALEGAAVKTPEDLVTNGGSYIPQVGDLAFFGSKSTGDAEKNYCSHVGLITEVNLTYSGKTLTRIEVITTEGNYSQKVKQNDYVFDFENRNGHAYGSTYLNTFAVPNYNSKAEGTVTHEYPTIDIGAYGGTLLRLNSTGSAVRELQFGLNLVSVLDDGSIPVQSVDGSFGSATLAAVKKYQTECGLSVDGIVGKDTWSALRSDVVRLTKKTEDDCIVSGGRLYAYKGLNSAVKLPDSVMTIGADAFAYRPSVTSLTLPKLLKRIESGALSACQNLSSVVYTGTVTQYNSIVIDEGNSILQKAEVSCRMINVSFTVGQVTKTVILESGTQPTVPAGLDLTVADDARYTYSFAGWRLNGVLYQTLPKLTDDCSLVAEFTATERVLSVQTLNDLLVALANAAEDDITRFDFVKDGVLNIADLNELLVLLATV